MITHDFVSKASRAWRAAGCSLQRPDVYDAAVDVVKTKGLDQLAEQLESSERGRG